MSSNTDSRWNFNPRRLVGLIKKTTSKDKNSKPAKKKKGFIFRRSASQDSFTNKYNYFRTPFGGNSVPAGYNSTLYDEISPNSVFTNNGIEKDADFQRKNLSPDTRVPVVPDFDIPDQRTNRPSLGNVFDLTQENNKSKSKAEENGGTKTVDNTALFLELSDDDNDDDDDDINPYDEDSFHSNKITNTKQKPLMKQESSRSSAINSDISTSKRDRRKHNKEGVRYADTDPGYDPRGMMEAQMGFMHPGLYGYPPIPPHMMMMMYPPPPPRGGHPFPPGYLPPPMRGHPFPPGYFPPPIRGHPFPPRYPPRGGHPFPMGYPPPPPRGFPPPRGGQQFPPRYPPPKNYPRPIPPRHVPPSPSSSSNYLPYFPPIDEEDKHVKAKKRKEKKPEKQIKDEIVDDEDPFKNLEDIPKGLDNFLY